MQKPSFAPAKLTEIFLEEREYLKSTVNSWILVIFLEKKKNLEIGCVVKIAAGFDCKPVANSLGMVSSSYCFVLRKSSLTDI